jgi:hypothetical protein
MGNSKKHELSRLKVQKSPKQFRNMAYSNAGLDTLYGLCDPGLQDALKCGKGLI